MAPKNQDYPYRQSILQYTRSIDYLNKFSHSQPIFWLAEEIRAGKQRLKYNSVDFIIAKILDKKENLINYSQKDFINLYVIGTFKSYFIPTMKVSQALAEFYLEMRVLPNIITITKKDFNDNAKTCITRIKNGIRIYDREGNIH